MTIIAIQIAVRLALGNNNGVSCTKDSLCTGGICDNPTQSDGGGHLTCCQDLGTSCATASDCCTFGSSYVTCYNIPTTPNNVCAVPPLTPGVDAGYVTCNSTEDCAPESPSTYEEGYQCLGTFVVDGGSLGTFQRQYWLPFDAGSVDGQQFGLALSACGSCLQSSNTIPWNPGGNDQPCVLCCTGNCFQSADHSNAVCCSDFGQICVSDADCCPDPGTNALSKTCTLSSSCTMGFSEYCSDAGEVGTCSTKSGYPCVSDDQCRSGFCDAGVCSGGC